ncbi:MAG: hypothetical protein K9L66_10725 [Spirochaetaceae bacterium]|nr:hypothetical protein [Spirochaetaceae bacterium]MCF7949563.1 hypothetical protein [Spirochaetia bacterium]MCF7952001.1 hypothetical protein [Spirochaetaceae bacterium]
MRKIMMVVAISLLCLAAVMQLTAQTSNSDVDADAKEIIAKMTAAMNLLAQDVEEMSSPEDFIEACNRYTETVEAYGKKMFGLIKAHPEWGENPPEEMQATLDEYGEALLRYDPALSAITRYANDHYESEAVQAAMKRLNTAVYNMYR